MQKFILLKKIFCNYFLTAYILCWPYADCC